MKATRAARAARKVQEEQTQEVVSTPKIKRVEEDVSEIVRPSVVYPLQTSRRLLLAFLIGLPMTMMFGFNEMSTPFWWQPEIPMMVLLFAMLFSIARDPLVTEGKLAQKRVRSAMLTGVLLIIAYLVLEILLLNSIALLGFILIPVVTGLVAGFALSGGRVKGFALFCGVFAWLGAAIGNLLAVTYNTIIVAPGFIKTHPKVTLGQILMAQLLIVALPHMTGLAIAAVGGELGWRLRRRVLGPESVLEGTWASNRRMKG